MSVEVTGVGKNIAQPKVADNKQDVSVAEPKDKRVKETDKEQDKESAAVSPKTVESVAERANKKMSSTHIEFSYNENVNRVSITVFDDATGEVIREIPPEESLKMLEKMWEITGLLVDEKR